MTQEINFDQVYSDGEVTHWRALYDHRTDAMVNGVWTGACDGTFTGVRHVSSETKGTSAGES